MSQISGSWSAELPTERIGRELALEVVAQLDRVDFIGAMADAVVRRMGRDQPAGSDQYERAPDPDPGAGPRHGARFGGVADNGTVLPEDPQEG